MAPRLNPLLATCLTALALALGCGSETKSSAPVGGSDAAASGDTATAGDSSTAIDTGGAGDTAGNSDTAGPSDTAGNGDATADSSASPAESACTALASAICAGAQSCCGGTAPATCQADWAKACLKLGWADLDEALSAATLQKDSARSGACQQAVEVAVQNCDRQAASRALGLCMRAWVDPAKLGEPCAAPVELPCAGGSGRCTAKTIDAYVCTNAVGEGASCSLTQPCKVGLECLDSGLTRAKTCGKPGSTCNLADKCWDGWQCEAGACVKASASAPATCAKDEDCPGTHACAAGKCSPKLCQ